MKTVKGDLVKLALEGKFDLIVHGCNCFCTMGAGIAKTIKQKFPAAYQADLATAKGDQSKLGTASWAEVQQADQKLIIVNAYTQFNWRGRGKKADYEAIRKAFQQIKNQFSGLRIAYPAIGAGLAGGDWKIISKIIEEELNGEDHTFVKFQK
ncbi:MAG: macro domain-containing protein [Saprospiraceae bacterium]|nr:macro domain-containing protein [Saprospiraceae bacterium]